MVVIFSIKNLERDHLANEILVELEINNKNIIFTKGRRNFMLSRGIDRLSGYNIEIFLPHSGYLVEVASINCYQYLNQITHISEQLSTQELDSRSGIRSDCIYNF